MTESMSKSWRWKEKAPTKKVRMIIHCDFDNPANFPTSEIIFLSLEACPLCCGFSFYEISVLWKTSAEDVFLRRALPCQRTAVGPCGTSSCCRLQLWRHGWCRGWCRPSGTSCTCHLGCRLWQHSGSHSSWLLQVHLKEGINKGREWGTLDR